MEDKISLKWLLIGVTFIALSFVVAIKTAWPNELTPDYIKAQEIISKKKISGHKQKPVFNLAYRNYWDDSGTIHFSVNQQIISPISIQNLTSGSRMINYEAPNGSIILLPGPPPRNYAAEPFVEWSKEKQ